MRAPIKQRDERSYIKVVKEKPFRNVIYQTSEEDNEWLSHSLVGIFSRGTAYAKIKNKMLRTLHNMEGFWLLEASKAILTFKTQQDMQFAANEEKDFWGNYFEELRPWCIIDKAFGKSPYASLNEIINLAIDKEKVKIIILEIKNEACTNLPSLIYSLGYTPESDSELDCNSSPSESETVVIKEKQDIVANKNFTFTDLDHKTKVIMKQSFSRCETVKEGYMYGYEA
ncbi:hypothetical protein NC653_014006 [Populus alba x Populus x berolinensis]|uniref:Uncharacterized protein n=1 Tax=Populus alba x Populus x berolinensis TaxID=444605 RepID=A0AAD6W389_9ROSI|nr:hypothetical protein NC653_014006 [Populus alba x Populus x berolinensis]